MPDGLAAFEDAIARGHEVLGSRAVWNNSTAFGGGVAEMLCSLIGYVRRAGLDGRWVVIAGDAEFFRITKRLHNRLVVATRVGRIQDQIEDGRAASSSPATSAPSATR